MGRRRDRHDKRRANQIATRKRNSPRKVKARARRQKRQADKAARLAAKA